MCISSLHNQIDVHTLCHTIVLRDATNYDTGSLHTIVFTRSMRRNLKKSGLQIQLNNN